MPDLLKILLLYTYIDRIKHKKFHLCGKSLRLVLCSLCNLHKLAGNLKAQRYRPVNHRKLTLMRLPTKRLIAKIESLSSQLSPDQLNDFLDVLDSLAIMVEDAKAMPSSSEHTGLKEVKSALH